MVYKRNRNRSRNRNRNLSEVGTGTVINSYGSATLEHRQYYPLTGMDLEYRIRNPKEEEIRACLRIFTS
jgi:hypothetical protein